MKKICIVSTVELPIIFFMLPHLRMLQTRYDVTVVLQTDNIQFLEQHNIRVRVVSIPIERKISLIKDIKALIRLITFFRLESFDMVHSIAPKAGLLAMIAGLIAGIPRRLHCFTGQVWATASGFRRQVLKWSDRLLVLCATHLLADSASQKVFLIQEKIVSKAKIMVLCNGSVCGVDLDRFRFNPDHRLKVRSEHGVTPDAVLFLYLGRLTRDKGIIDLAKAFTRLTAEGVDADLLVVGPDEEGMQSVMKATLGVAVRRAHFVGYTTTPEQLLTAADVLCLPSYREGFGMVILEAAAIGIPSIASGIYGITDAVLDGVTGFLHEPGDVTGICGYMRTCIELPDTRKQLGVRARQRAADEFSQTLLVTAMQHYYEHLMERVA